MAATDLVEIGDFFEADDALFHGDGVQAQGVEQVLSLKDFASELELVLRFQFLVRNFTLERFNSTEERINFLIFDRKNLLRGNLTFLELLNNLLTDFLQIFNFTLLFEVALF